MADFLGNTCAKYYENPTMLSKVTAKNVGNVFLRHTVYTESGKIEKKTRKTKANDQRDYIKRKVDVKRISGTLFDIAHANAMDMMTIEEDKQFLQLQL